MKVKLTRLAGDGVGPEIMMAAQHVLAVVAKKYNIEFLYTDCLFGGAAVDATGTPFPQATHDACQAADAILLGAVGGPQYDGLPAAQRPEKGLLDMRKALGLFANIRPVITNAAMARRTPFRDGHLSGVDIYVVRELTGGIYFGEKERTEDWAKDVCTYTRDEIVRILRVAGTQARKRKKKVTSVDKSNVLMTSKLWRETANHIFQTEFSDVTLEHMLVDAMAMKLISQPNQFDVIVTENMFGDILTDEASMLAGSIGLLPSASLSNGGPGVFEPIHGSAPDIAGQGKANPIGMLASVGMMLDALGAKDAAGAVQNAIDAALVAGECTSDVGGTLNCDAAAKAIAERI